MTASSHNDLYWDTQWKIICKLIFLKMVKDNKFAVLLLQKVSARKESHYVINGKLGIHYFVRQNLR
jgi:hypothetical protein